MYFRAHSPTDTSRTNTLGEEANEATATNGQCDKVVYAAPAQTVTVPHQTSVAGELYAVSTKNVNKKSQEQPLQEQPPVDIGEPKKVEGVSGNTSYIRHLYITDVRQSLYNGCLLNSQISLSILVNHTK